MPSEEDKKVKDVFLKKRRQALVVLIALPAFFAVSVYIFTHCYDFLCRITPGCVFNRFFGLNCIMCGGTRCAVFLLKGDVVKACYYNPYVVLCLMGAAVSYLCLLVRVLRKRYRPIPMKHVMNTLWILLALSIAFLIVRNLDFYKAFFF